ncbi:MAG: O-antigen ligase family protein [Hyphomicrobiales bacterium]|nr:O-antigen ligase family protein [Hyphomicrobiales bacterium]
MQYRDRSPGRHSVVLLYLFIALVALAPLPLGGNNPMAWTINALVAGLLSMGFAIENMRHRHPPKVPLRWLWFPAFLYVGVCLWALIQSLSISPDALHHPLWSLAADAMGHDVEGAISVNPYVTRTALLRLMTYGAVFWLALQLGRERQKADLILNSLAFAITAYAIYGLVLWSAGSRTILWYDKWAYQSVLTATFINRNSFATYAGMGSIGLLGLFLWSLRNALRSHPDDLVKRRVARLVRSISGMAGLYLLALAVTLTALFLTSSRAGFAATMLALAMLLILTLMHGRIGAIGTVIALAACLAVFIFLFNLTGEGLVERLSGIEASAEQRVNVYARTFQAIVDSPWLGTGYGTFENIFPIYRDETISAWGVWDLAHNSYLENMLELGVPAAFALFVAIGSCAWLCLRGASSRLRAVHFPLIGFAASLLVALHSLVDFSLQMPGVAITFAALLGLGVAQSWSSRAQPGRPANHVANKRRALPAG